MTPVDPTRRAFLRRLLGATASASVLPAVAGSAVSPSSLAIIESAAAPLRPLAEPLPAAFLEYAALRREMLRAMDDYGLTYEESRRHVYAAHAESVDSPGADAAREETP